MEEDGYDAVYIGVGAGLPKFMNMEGEHLVGVLIMGYQGRDHAPGEVELAAGGQDRRHAHHGKAAAVAGDEPGGGTGSPADG